MTRLSIERPLTVLMGILTLVLMGCVAYGYLRVDRLPPVSFGVVFVDVTYPQAAAQDVEELVTKPIEDALAGVAGADSITSTSNEGRSRVRIQLVEGTNQDLATIDVERRIARIRNRLPADAQNPTVRKADPNEIPIMNVALTGAALDDLFDIATTQISPALQSVPGVAAVNVTGGLQREVQVQVDSTRLAARNISVQQVSTALAAANVTSTVGRYQQSAQLLNLRAIGRFQTAAQLEELVVAQTPGGPVLLRDVATVIDGFKEQTQLQRLNGEDAVGLSVVKASDANALLVADGVSATLARLQPLLPKGSQYEIRNDASVFIRASLQAIQTDLFLAVLLVGLVTLLFLHEWRNVLIIVLSIPTSLVSTLFLMYLMGFTLNIMTLMALALSVGVLVDASIVVIENIHRHLQQGESPKVAALRGRNEIGLATLAIAAADVVVYLPVAFMTGFIGQLFRQYGLTIVVATLFSLLISFTLTPMLASRWLRQESHATGPLAAFGRGWDALFGRLADAVGRIVPWSIRARWGVVVTSLLLVAGSVALIQFRWIGSEFAPTEDDNNFQVTLTTPSGVSLQGTDEATRKLEDALRQLPEVDSLFTSVTVAGAGQFPGAGGRAVIGVQLVEKHDRSRSALEVIQEVRRMGRQIPGASIVARPSSPLPGGAGTGRLDLDVVGPEMDTLMAIVSDVVSVASQVDGLTDVVDSGSAGTPEVHIVLDPVRLAQLNITAQAAIDALRTTLGGRVVSELRPTGKLQQDITLIASDLDRGSLTTLSNIPIRGGATLATINQAAPQPSVTLGQVATISYGTGPVEITRIDRNRATTVTGSVAGRTLGDVSADLKSAISTVSLPAGYQIRPGRQVNQFNDALTLLLQAITLAVVLEYMLLVALYQSWFHPLVLMLSVPLGLVGSIVGLWITGNTINIFSLIGLIMAFGLVAKNGILLIDFANTLRDQGMERTAALAEAAKVRLRPILMTSATMVFGMLPLAMQMETGGESRAPMAVVVIGAIITSTVLAVVVLPAVYVLLDDLQALLARRPSLVAAPTGQLGDELIPEPAVGHTNGRGWGPIRYARQLLASRNGVHAPSQMTTTRIPEPPA